MYKIASWNVRGLNSPFKKAEILSWIRKNKVEIVALLEVKLQENKWVDAVTRCSPDDGWRAEFSTCERGWARILLLWNSVTTKISNIQKFYHFMTCEVEADNKRFGMVIIYASNNQRERTLLWDEVEKESKRFTGSWLCLGDFNCVKDQREKYKGIQVTDKDTYDFRKFLSSTGLQDIPASGCYFTWNNNHTNPADRIWSKLDIALGNSVWFDEMEEAQANVLAPGISDHSPIIVSWGEERRYAKNFRYCNFWETLDEYGDSFSSAWRDGRNCRNMFMLQAKLKNMKVVM
ncbi:unnamed protein product [Rhodiola kirilowii]